MPVNTPHPKYTENLQHWEKSQDFAIGAKAVKSASKCELYLPRLFDMSDDKYKIYLGCAIFYSYSADHVQQYIGQAFREDPEAVLPSDLQYMLNDVDGTGISIYQQAQEALEQNFIKGRFGLLADYPMSDGALSLAEQKKQNIRPKIVTYKAESIINWRLEMVNNEIKPVLIVLQEIDSKVDDKDPFVTNEIPQWRVLGLDEDGYYVEVWQEVNDGRSSGFEVISRIEPVDAKGNRWEFIPFQIIGSKYNSWDIQDIPNAKMVEVEHGLYQNSGSLEWSIHWCGFVQAIARMSDEAREWYQEEDEDGKIKHPFKLGSENVLLVSDGGGLEFVTAPKNAMAEGGIAKKLEIMSQISKSLYSPNQAVKTATQADNEATAQHSQASLLIANINEAFHNALMWCCRYAGIEDKDLKFVINQQITKPQFDIPLFTAISKAVDEGKAPKSALYRLLREYGAVDKELTDEEIYELIEGDMGSIGFDGDV